MQRYTHSGIVPVSGAASTVLWGLAAAILGGVLYALLAHWLSWGIFRVFLMFFYGLGVGLAVGVAANWGKIRSPLFNTVVALVCVAIGMWVYWGAYDVARNGMQVAGRAWTPRGLAAQAADLFEKGSFVMKGRRKVNEWPLALAWVAEGICVTGLAVATARKDAARPFCESCLQWTNSTSGLIRVAADGKEPAWQEVLAGDLTAVAVFAPTDLGASPHVRLDLASCPACQHSNFVTLSSVTIKRDSKGKKKTTEWTLIQNGAITDPEAEFLREFARQLHGDDEGDDSDDDGGGDEDWDDDSDDGSTNEGQSADPGEEGGSSSDQRNQA